MTLPLFPKLPGRSWPTNEIMETSTLVKRASSGRRTAVSMFAVPIYHIELKYAGLSSDSVADGLGKQSQQALQALFGAMGGQYGTFYVKKSDYTANDADSTVTGQLLGVGDGANTIFIGTRTIQTDYVDDYAEPVGAIKASGLKVYVDGVLQDASTYDLVSPNVIQFHTAPAAGKNVRADYTWYFVCAFEDDMLDLMVNGRMIWSADSIKLVTVKP